MKFDFDVVVVLRAPFAWMSLNELWRLDWKHIWPGALTCGMDMMMKACDCYELIVRTDARTVNEDFYGDPTFKTREEARQHFEKLLFP